jgi:hypothetical protein
MAGLLKLFFEASIKIVFWKSFVSKVATLPERNNTGFSGDHNDQPYFYIMYKALFSFVTLALPIKSMRRNTATPLQGSSSDKTNKVIDE